MFVGISVIILNLALWAVFFMRLNGKFNIRRFTDSTRAELEKTIREMNEIVVRNIGLIDGKIGELDGKIAELRRFSEVIDKKILRQSDEVDRLSLAAKKASEAGAARPVPLAPLTYKVEFPKIPLEPPREEDGSPSVQDDGAADSERVRELYSSGLGAEEIAQKLDCTVSEVQFIIDMNF